MARIYQTRSWHDQMSPSIEELELLALETYAHLPEQFRSLTGEIVIRSRNSRPTRSWTTCR